MVLLEQNAMEYVGCCILNSTNSTQNSTHLKHTVLVIPVEQRMLFPKGSKHFTARDCNTVFRRYEMNCPFKSPSSSLAETLPAKASSGLLVKVPVCLLGADWMKVRSAFSLINCLVCEATHNTLQNNTVQE